MTEVITQPDWLIETVGGLTTSRLYRVFLEGKRFAIIHCPGHNGYINRMDGVKYAPSKYVLVEKGKKYWSYTWKDVHNGRLTKEAKLKMEGLLAEAEKSG